MHRRKKNNKKNKQAKEDKEYFKTNSTWKRRMKADEGENMRKRVQPDRAKCSQGQQQSIRGNAVASVSL